MNINRVVNLMSTLMTLITLFGITLKADYFISPTHFHKTVYIDPDFDDSEVMFIVSAVLEWNESTRHIIDFELKSLNFYIPAVNNFKDALIITKVNGVYPQILILDKVHDQNTLGVYNKDSLIPYIILVNNKINDSFYKAVVMHELGHACSFEHSSEMGALMYPNIDLASDQLMPDDFRQLCELYRCDIKEFVK